MRSLWLNRHLLMQMVQREVVGRYKGSVMGLSWSFLHPLLMLAVYTFVFGVVFQARWQTSASHEDFALNLFAGLVVFGVFAECITRAPGLVLANINYVKKVVFPLEILAPSIVIAALFHAAISLIILLMFYMFVHGVPHLTVLWLPVIWLPFILLVLGLSWFLSALGVYLRDVAQVIGVMTTALMFLSPIFYPVSALPEGVRDWMFLNPLALIIEQTRSVILLGQAPDGLALAIYAAVSAVIYALGFVWFKKTRKGFADVL
jgi:homopolymeric O-antigen transport system permease protein